jgi:predicted acetyltransferase
MPTTPTIEPCKSVEEMIEALAVIFHYFGIKPKEEDADRWTRTLETPRMHAARENGAIVGGAGAFTFELTVPGGTVRAAGITVVGVLPTHRRRGILSAMMRAQLDDVRRRGEPVAYLWASEETIYGRFGYGIASLCGEIELPRHATAFARPVESGAQTRMLGEEEALEPFSRIYDRVRLESPGMFSRTQDWWKVRRLADPESRRQGGGVLNRILLTIDGRPEGYALYRMHQSMEGGASTGFLNVIEAVGATPGATAAIWRFLLDVDWIARVKAFQLPVDHPLFFLLARPRAMRFRVNDALWVRLVDVQAALAARTLGAGDPVVFEVVDPFCPWNEGRHRVGGGRVERTNDAPDIALDVNGLGSVYLGGFSFAQLAASGRVQELRRDAIKRADALFPRGRAPWCPEIF